jgi:hypothetical protein
MSKDISRPYLPRKSRSPLANARTLGRLAMRQRSPADRGQFDFALGAVLLARRKSAGRWVAAGAAIAVLVFQLVEYGERSGILPTSGASPLSC